jgi:DNA topoisomerase-1
VPCPKCASDLSERRSRRGKTFYGCTAYPKCDFVSWDRPRSEKCPLCENPWLVEKFSKRDGEVVACPNKECGYRRAGTEASPGASP